MSNVVSIFSRGTLVLEGATEAVLVQRNELRRQAALMPLKKLLVRLFLDIMQEGPTEKMANLAAVIQDIALASDSPDVVRCALAELQSVRCGCMPVQYA